MNTFDLTLDLSKRGLIQTVSIRQGDQNGTTIKATITDHGVAASTSGMTARVCMRLPNGTEYYRKAATLSGNVATVTIDEAQAASAVGRTDVAYFQLLQGSTVVASTESFTVVVLPDALADATVPESYDSAIQEAIDNLDAAVENLPATVEDVLADHPEWTTTVQDGSITEPKLATDLARDRERLLYRLDNLLTNALPEGDVATATDAAKTPLAGLALYGRSTQDGTPTPSAPVPIESVGGANLLDDGAPGVVTSHGITVTPESDGWFRVSGTATGTTGGALTIWGSSDLDIPAGAYTAVVETDGTPFVESLLRLRVYASSSLAYISDAGRYALNATAAITRIDIYFAATSAGTVVDGRFRIAIYAGSTAYPYVPYGNAGLWARGRNLLTMNDASATSKGITFEFSSDGSVHISGTATGEIGANSSYTDLPAGTYTLSADTSQLKQINVYNSSGGGVGHTTGGKLTFTLAEPTSVRIYPIVTNGTTLDVTIWPQIERGTTATAYEPYSKSVQPAPLDGHELRSLPDGTRDEVTVGADGHAVLIQRVGFQHISEFTSVNNSLAKATLEGGRDNVKWAESVCLCDKLVNNTSASASDAMRRLQDVIKAARNSGTDTIMRCVVNFDGSQSTLAEYNAKLAEIGGIDVLYPLETPVAHDLGYVTAVPLVGPDLTAQAVPSAPFALTYERDLNVTLARLESAIATLV